MRSSDQRLKHSPTEIQNLHDIIDSSTPDRLRTVLKYLIATSSANYTYVKGELMLEHGTLKRAWSKSESDDNGDEHEDSGLDYESDYSDEQADTSASRRRFEICEQCGEEYDVLLNDKTSCKWHDGKLHTLDGVKVYIGKHRISSQCLGDQEVDWDGDFWADHDERCHGTIDTPEMRKEYPEGFVWSCCDEPGDADGCKTSRHRPNRAKRVRR